MDGGRFTECEALLMVGGGGKTGRLPDGGREGTGSFREDEGCN